MFESFLGGLIFDKSLCLPLSCINIKIPFLNIELFQKYYLFAKNFLFLDIEFLIGLGNWTPSAPIVVDFYYERNLSVDVESIFWRLLNRSLILGFFFFFLTQLMSWCLIPFYYRLWCPGYIWRMTHWYWNNKTSVCKPLVNPLSYPQYCIEHIKLPCCIIVF